jgi:putative membrane protein
MMNWGNMMGSWGPNGLCSGGGWLGMGNMLFQLILFIGLVAIMVKMFRNKGSKTLKNDNDNALNLLKIRYARGEINTDEYIQKKDNLRA